MRSLTRPSATTKQNKSNEHPTPHNSNRLGLHGPSIRRPARHPRSPRAARGGYSTLSADCGSSCSRHSGKTCEVSSMTYEQIDKMHEQIRALKISEQRARDHAVWLQDQLEAAKARLSSRARKNASKRNGLKGGRPKKNKTT